MPTYRVKEGHRHGAGGRFGPGDLVELTEAEAAGFLDKLELVDAAGQPAPARMSGLEMWPDDWSNLLIGALQKAGYTPGDLAAATDAQLLAVSGIGEGNLKKIRDHYPKS